jgi:hypothetical protein
MCVRRPLGLFQVPATRPHRFFAQSESRGIGGIGGSGAPDIYRCFRVCSNSTGSFVQHVEYNATQHTRPWLVAANWAYSRLVFYEKKKRPDE